MAEIAVPDAVARGISRLSVMLVRPDQVSLGTPHGSARYRRLRSTVRFGGSFTLAQTDDPEEARLRELFVHEFSVGYPDWAALPFDPGYQEVPAGQPTEVGGGRNNATGVWSVDAVAPRPWMQPGAWVYVGASLATSGRLHQVVSNDMAANRQSVVLRPQVPYTVNQAIHQGRTVRAYCPDAEGGQMPSEGIGVRGRRIAGPWTLAWEEYVG